MDWWVLGCSLAGAIGTAIAVSPAWGAGFAFGAFLSWLNLRLIRSGADALGRAARNQKIRRARWAGRGRFWLGLAVAAAGLYAIFVLRWVPWQAVLAGLFAAFAGVFLFAIGELFRPVILPPEGSSEPAEGADSEAR